MSTGAVRTSRTWPALLLAPLFALADQSVAYALVGWSCAHQQPAVLHAVHAVFLLLAIAAAVPAWFAMRPTLDRPKNDAGATGDRPPFLAMTAFFTGALSAWVIFSMWIPQWVLSPCFA